jgi:hypothetical protein
MHNKYWRIGHNYLSLQKMKNNRQNFSSQICNITESRDRLLVKLVSGEIVLLRKNILYMIEFLLIKYVIIVYSSWFNGIIMTVLKLKMIVL